MATVCPCKHKSDTVTDCGNLHLAYGVVLLLGDAGVAVRIHAVDTACVGVSGLCDGLGLQAIISNLCTAKNKSHSVRTTAAHDVILVQKSPINHQAPHVNSSARCCSKAGSTYDRCGFSKVFLNRRKERERGRTVSESLLYLIHINEVDSS
jgi:hypothetical protein